MNLELRLLTRRIEELSRDLVIEQGQLYHNRNLSLSEIRSLKARISKKLKQITAFQSQLNLLRAAA